MKQMKAFITAAAMLASLVGAVFPEKTMMTAGAKDPAAEGVLNFLVYDDHAALEKCLQDAEGTVEIPAEVNGLPVTEILEDAFYACSGLTAVMIPDSVTDICRGAFRKCTGLTGITIPDSVTGIGADAFEFCTGLTDITIPDGVTIIGDAAFSCCYGLTGVTIPDSVTEIGMGAFWFCRALTDITIPDSVNRIAYMTFCDCTALQSITIPDSVTAVDGSAFRHCTALESITIPGSVESFGTDVFTGCDHLTVKGLAGSAAEQYAAENSIPFFALSDTAETGTDSAQERLMGDFNGNGAADSADAVLLIRFISEDQTLSADTKKHLIPENADFDGNRLLTALDVAGLLSLLREG